MKNIKLLICYHKPATLFKDEIFTPIHVGRANARKKSNPDDKNFKWMLENMIGDDTGENISNRNGSYNEMTSLYWAWKNYDELGNPDYIGLMHYRRHFVWRENECFVYNIENFDEDSYLKEINYSPDNVEKMLDGCDYIAHIGKVINVYKHYIENHRKEDLDLAVQIMLEKYPEYEMVTKEYFAQDYSNFCNMFIFNRKIFFEYCEWVFDILEEFERRVDTSEKRFFISERLTGIFIAKLMKDEALKYKVLPISFIEDPVKIPIVLPINKDNIFQSANAITSILESAKGYNLFQFYLLHNGSLETKEKEKFQYFEEKYSFCKLQFVEIDMKEEYYPLYISELLGRENKCIYISGDILALQDLGEFYRICSTDDYYVVGTPLEKYEVEEEEKRVSQSILTLNCARLRQHKMWDKVKVRAEEGEDGIELFNDFCKGQIGYIPWYFVTRESEYPYKNVILGDSKPRGQVQMEATWRAWLVYDEVEPWINSQGVYSVFWWDSAVKVPAGFKFPLVRTKELQVLYSKQQKEINELDLEARKLAQIIPNENDSEAWREYGFAGKLKFYYQHNGLKKTIAYAFKKSAKMMSGKEKVSHV